MNENILEQIRNQTNDLQTELTEIRKNIADMLGTIDSGKFLPIADVNVFSDRIGKYKNKLTAIMTTGEKLGVSICDSIDETKKAFDEYEKRMSLTQERDIVLDYLRIVTNDETNQEPLEESKALLIEKCRNEETIKEEIRPFKEVVNAIREKLTQLDDDLFDLIEENISKKIARSVDHGKLTIDPDHDISRYLDDSCTILMRDKAGEKQEETAAQDETTVQGETNVQGVTNDGADVKNGQTMPVDEQTGDEAKNDATCDDSGDNGTADGGKAQADTPDVKGEAGENGAAGKKEEIEEAGVVGGFPDTLESYASYIGEHSFEFKDVPVSEFTVSGFKKVYEKEPLIANFIYEFEMVKLFDPNSIEEQFNKETIKGAINILVENGYAAYATVTVFGKKHQFLSLTSKGYASLQRKDTKVYFKNLPEMPQYAMLQPCKLSAYYAAQIALLYSYPNAKGELYGVFSPDWTKDHVVTGFYRVGKKTSALITGYLLDKTMGFFDVANIANGQCSETTILVENRNDAFVLTTALSVLECNKSDITFDIGNENYAKMPYVYREASFVEKSVKEGTENKTEDTATVKNGEVKENGSADPEKNGDEDIQETPESTWADLGIDDPAPFTVDNSDLEVITNTSKQADKSFSVKEFKQNYVKKIGPAGSHIFDLLFSEIFVNECCYLPDNSEETPILVNKLDKLVTLGYVSKIDVTGFNSFYVLTQKGFQIINTSAGKEVLGLPFKAKNPMYRYVDNDNPILKNLAVAAALHMQFYRSVRMLNNTFEANNAGFTVNNGIIWQSLEKQEECYVGLSYTADSVGCLANLVHNRLENASSSLPNKKTMIILSRTKRTSIALTEWLLNRNYLDGYESIYIYSKETDTTEKYTAATNNDAVNSSDVKVSDNADDTVEELPNTPPSEQAEKDSTPQEETLPEDFLPEDFAKRFDSANIFVTDMIENGKTYCATAYLYALKQNNPIHELRYLQLAYAVDDPLCNCEYSSKKLFDVYFNGEVVSLDAYLVSAVLRNFYYDQTSYDYDMQRLFDAISENSVFSYIQDLKSLVRRFMDFKKDNLHGARYYAHSLIQTGANNETDLKSICAEARTIYQNITSGIKQKTSSPYLLETKRLLFIKTGDLAQNLLLVAENLPDTEQLLTDYLQENFIKDGTDLTAETIDNDKFSNFIEAYWDKAQNQLKGKPGEKLPQSFRDSLKNSLSKIISVLCRYVVYHQSAPATEKEKGFQNYTIAKKAITEKLTGCYKDILSGIKNGDLHESCYVLSSTLKQIVDEMNGTSFNNQRKYFYLPFLKNDYVLLNNQYLPVLDDIEGLPEMSAAKRVLKHYESKENTFFDQLQKIFLGEDDYGTADLIIDYLRREKIEDADPDELRAKWDEGIKHPESHVEKQFHDFEESLELAQMYGQLETSNEDLKELILTTALILKDEVSESKNFGFFNKVLKAFLRQIENQSLPRAKELQSNLESYKEANPSWKESELLQKAVRKTEDRIKAKMYSAAEDMLNRMQNGDIENRTSYFETDYLTDFLDNYSVFQQSAGTSTSGFHFKDHNTNKEVKGGKTLLDNWPSNKGIGADKIKKLLITLGFNVDDLTIEPSIKGMDHFGLKIKNAGNGRKSNYKHPVYCFGSRAEGKTIRVVCAYGKRKPDDLIEFMKDIGGLQDTLFFVDCSLNVSERRELARKTKKEILGKTFLVIDRVAIIYLAMRYSQTAINRMLMSITVPFSYFQPYIAESAKIMPPEIFMGRKAELERIESPSGVNIVYGGRQLGKSALLRMAQEDIEDDENGDRAILVDIKGLDYKQAAKKIAETLHEYWILDEPIPEETITDWNVLAYEIKKALLHGTKRGTIPYFLLLLDECDAFLESCAEVNYAPFDVLKDIQNVGPDRFKFVVAGLRNVIRFQKKCALGNNSVLTHFPYLTVKPFKTTEARELLEVPLNYLGFRFPEDGKTDMLISNIFDMTNYFPGLIQSYCSKLVEAMRKDYGGYDEIDSPPYYIKEEHIKKVLADKELLADVKEKFEITLGVGDDKYYEELANLVAHHYHFYKSQFGCSVQDIKSLADGYGVRDLQELDLNGIIALMEELVELNVFQKVGNENYRFARHSFINMMGTPQEIDDTILSYSDKEET